jgi:hypothetical protein
MSSAVVVSGRCLGYEANSNAVCPAAAAAYVADIVQTLGPVQPTSLSNLLAVTNAATTADWTVDILANGAVAMSCVVPATGTTCTAAGPVSISGNNYLQVRVTGSGTTRAWRVSFRY